jgi:thiol-disulfide isomerase/thioredoxin
MKKVLLIVFLLVGMLTEGTAALAAAAQEGDKLAPASFQSLDGETVQLPPGDGKLYVINLWATWCSPCQEEMPALQAFYDKHKGEGKIGLFLINYEEDEKTVRSFLQDKGFDMPVLLDPTGQGIHLLATRYIPATVVINGEGVIIFRRVGALTLSELEEAVQVK